MRVLLWDFDNTLAYRPGQWSQCLADVANNADPDRRLTRDAFAPQLQRGFPWHTPERVHAHGATADSWWESLYPVFANAFVRGACVCQSKAEGLARQVRSRYLDQNEWVVFDDTEDALRVLTGKGWRHVLLSNHVPELHELVKALNLAHHFDAIHTSGLTGYEKPNPLAFQVATQGLPHGSEVHMVGDSYASDYQGAIGAGLRAHLVRTKHANCPYALPDLAALVVLLGST